jgi:dipeptidyl aminopeptidase/acylaminoacyl peptidase
MRSAAIASFGLIAFLAACASGGGAGGAGAVAQPGAARAEPTAALAARAGDCSAAEAPVLRNHVQLTFADRFAKAGENYFSPDDRRIVFQAVERPKDGGAPSEFYSMYVADVVRDAGGRITGIDGIRRISPEGSANTCGWFHPKDPNVVIFGSTVVPPSNRETPGYQRGTGRYRWQFPPEMRVVQCDLRTADGTAQSLRPLVGDGNGYAAECSLSPDARTLLYTEVDPKTQGDLWVLDMPTGERRRIVQAPGYDGGPFFSPDGKRIIYRSDRREDNLLQIYQADLVRDASGKVTGIADERALTANEHVNWCPYYHPDGRHFVYGSSEVGHSNYEVLMRDAEHPERSIRITECPGADVLPVFSADGRWMLWTAQRGSDDAGGGKPSSQVWVAEFDLEAAKRKVPLAAGSAGDGARAR